MHMKPPVISKRLLTTNENATNYDRIEDGSSCLLESAYGNCSAEESPWQCGDPLEYQGYDYETVQIGEQSVCGKPPTSGL